jgi:hypothetical protein
VIEPAVEKTPKRDAPASEAPQATPEQGTEGAES